MTTITTSMPVPAKVRKQVKQVGEVLTTSTMRPGHLGEMLHYAGVYGAELIFYQQHPANISVDGERLYYKGGGKEQLTKLGIPLVTLSGHFVLCHDRAWFMLSAWDSTDWQGLVPADTPEWFRGMSCFRDYDKQRMVCFEVGCQHRNNTERTIGNCLHEHTCRDCGHRWQIDSSD